MFSLDNTFCAYIVAPICVNTYIAMFIAMFSEWSAFERFPES